MDLVNCWGGGDMKVKEKERIMAKDYAELYGELTIENIISAKHYRKIGGEPGRYIYYHLKNDKVYLTIHEDYKFSGSYIILKESIESVIGGKQIFEAINYWLSGGGTAKALKYTLEMWEGRNE